MLGCLVFFFLLAVFSVWLCFCFEDGGDGAGDRLGGGVVVVVVVVMVAMMTTVMLLWRW